MHVIIVTKTDIIYGAVICVAGPIFKMYLTPVERKWKFITHHQASQSTAVLSRTELLLYQTLMRSEGVSRETEIFIAS